MNEKDLITQAADWIHKEAVSVDGTKLACSLSPAQKYTIIKKYWASQDFSTEEKENLKKKCFEKDDSEAGLNC